MFSSDSFGMLLMDIDIVVIMVINENDWLVVISELFDINVNEDDLDWFINFVLVFYDVDLDDDVDMIYVVIINLDDVENGIQFDFI